MGRLSTHVLDTAHGRPASVMGYALFHLDGGARVPLTQGVTNADGRTDAPLLAGEAFAAGRYQLVFQVGAYFRSLGLTLPEPAFLDEVTLSFGMEAGGHYHVPLLVSPSGYSTYRGS
jgi:5-hydroxyisourate hydrolase